MMVEYIYPGRKLYACCTQDNCPVPCSEDPSQGYQARQVDSETLCHKRHSHKSPVVTDAKGVHGMLELLDCKSRLSCPPKLYSTVDTSACRNQATEVVWKLQEIFYF